MGTTLAGVLFSAIEAGLAALGEDRLRAIAESEDADAAIAARVLREHGPLQIRLLAGRILCVAAAAGLAAYSFRSAETAWAPLLVALGVGVAYGLLSAAVDAMVRQRAGRWTLRAVRLLRPFEILTIPFALPLHLLGRFIEREIPEAAPDEDAERVAELGIERLIEEGREEGSLAPQHAELLQSVLEFKNTVAREVMVPRTKMVAIELSTTIPEVLSLIVDKGHSRYPVYREKVDQVVGVLYAKDLFSFLRDGEKMENISLADLIRRRVFFAAETQKIGALLREMQARRLHLAVVVDEHGGTAGIVTLEDVLEEIVGDIRDEYDKETSQLLQLEQDRYIVDAGMSVYDLEDQLGVTFKAEDGDYDSLGGMLVELAGHVPEVGESMTVGDYKITVRDSDVRHVRRVEIRRALGRSQGGSLAAE
ncbi:MAG: hemolysin family protein [Myxococcota bacterium]